MPSRPKSHFWKRTRIHFRRFRITVWILILLLLVALVYLNHYGLPGFAKRRLIENLHANGVDLEFSRLRLSFFQGIVAENVKFGKADDPSSPQVSAAETQLQLNGKALRHFQIVLDGIRVRQGRLAWRLPETNAPTHELVLDKIQTEVRFLPGDQWSLDNFSAVFSGATIKVAGQLANASALREWKLWEGGQAASTAASQSRLWKLAEIFNRIRFTAPPELRLDVRGDARDFQSFQIRVFVNAPGARTPWGDVTRGQLVARLSPPDTNGLTRADLSLDAAGARTRWAAVTNLHLALWLDSEGWQSSPVKGTLQLTARQVQTKWGGGNEGLLTARWVHSITNPVPLFGRARFQCQQAQSPWGEASTLELSGDYSAPPLSSLPRCDASWGWWTNLQPYRADWRCAITGLRSPQIAADQLNAEGLWLAPRLEIKSLAARLYDGRLESAASLNVADRRLALALDSSIDPKKTGSLPGEEARRWLDQFTWQFPPRVNGGLECVLPAWTNRQPDWQAEVQPSLVITGKFALDGKCSYRGVVFDSARSQLSYSNLCWHLPDFTATRPEGRLSAEHRANDRTRDFYWRVSSSIYPDALRPALDAGQLEALSLLVFTRPPLIEAELWGRSHDAAKTGARGTVTLTNVTFREQAFSSVQTALSYTNGVLECLNPRVLRGAEAATADGLAANFNTQFVYLTNGVSSMDPMVIARTIGPHIARAIQPYRFDAPPAARVYGVIPMRGEEGADLHFDLKGGAFHWWKFNLSEAAAHVHWKGKTLDLTNLHAGFYKGVAEGWAAFDFTPEHGTAFGFSAAVTNALLQELMPDLSSGTNHMEGLLNGTVIVTKANTEDWHTVFGYGDMRLRDGLIWDMPLFGKLSPMLNAIVPGLGKSRISSATANYIITNGVVYSDDLEMRSPAMRLQYRGGVDLGGEVNARVQAELLRDLPILGPLVTTVLWPVTKIYEYKVTGELGDPKTEPIYLVPKLINIPLHPFRSIRNLFPDSSGATQTNAPASP